MNRVIFFLFAVCMVMFSSCSKSKDNSPSSNASLTVEGKSYSFPVSNWNKLSNAYYFCSAADATESELDFKLTDKIVGTYSNSKSTLSELSFVIGSDYYSYVAATATITITSSDSKTVSGTFTGKFYKNHITTTTYSVSGSFVSTYDSTIGK